MENSKIEWTDHTFNPWHGCMKVSEGCKNCYAETLDIRWKGGHWGPGSKRKMMSETYWQQPLKWNAAAEKAGKPAKVFCASMADVFEGHPNTLNSLQRLFQLIESTPNLIWQLLTKRPHMIMALAPLSWKQKFPENVWVGTSVENQKESDFRIRWLLKVPAKVRFVSCEPLLEFVDITKNVPGLDQCDPDRCCKNGRKKRSGIDWIIVGGESGYNARPVHPDWVRALKIQSDRLGAAFFFKQWGEWAPHMASKAIELKGVLHNGFGQDMCRVGKKAAGRQLDGIEYNEFPNV